MTDLGGSSPRRVREFETLVVDPDEILVDGRLDIYPSLKDSGYIELVISARDTRVRARGHVGVIPINDRLTLEVVPRVPLSNLARMLELSRPRLVPLAEAARTYDTEGDLYPSLAGLYARGLRQEIDRVVELGLLKDYQRTEEVSSFPRGRIEIGRSMQLAAKGVDHKAAVTWFQRSADNPVNRCLLYAVWSLKQYVDKCGDTISNSELTRIRRHLNWAWLRLPGVDLDLSESFLEDGLVTGAQQLPSLRSYYRQALDLALAIIGRRGIRLQGGGATMQLSSIVINMSDVFEDYLREVLHRAAAQELWPVNVYNGKVPPASWRLFPAPGRFIKATPDIVLRDDAAERVPVLIEVKYKPADKLPKREDLNQAITYAVAYGTPTLVVAQPRADKGGHAPGMHWLGRIAETDVFFYVADLSGDLELEEANLVSSIRDALAVNPGGVLAAS